MSQSEIIAGAIAAAFIVYLAMNNRLATYWNLLIGGAGSGGTGTGQGGVISGSGIANQAPGSQGTAGTPAVVGQPGSPAFVPTPPTLGNFITGNWWEPAPVTTQGTLTPAGSSAAAAAGAGIGMM